MAKKNNKVVRMKKSRFSLNVGVVVFGVILIYLFISLIIFFTTDKVKYYEVAAGSNAADNTKSYSGIALRTEKIENAKSSGFIEYFVREASRVSKKTTLYSIDSSGKMSDEIAKLNNAGAKLSSENISSLFDLLYDYSSDYDDMSFGDVYDFKSTLKGSVLDLINTKTIKKYAKESNISYSINKSAEAGIVLYKEDGYEKLKPKELDDSKFEKGKYSPKTFKTGDQVQTKDHIYKVITDDEWSIAFKLTDKEVQEYKDATGVKIKFSKDNLESTANIKVVKGKDGKNYGVVTLAKYLVRYAQDRFLDIQILEDVEDGLKIPKSSLIQKDVFVIPKDYGQEGGNGNKVGFNKKITKNGETTNEICYPSLAYVDDENYYVSTSSFNSGDVLVKPDSSECYTIGKTEKFDGVYNINNGYTVFVKVDILNSSNDYYIVRSGDVNSIAIYDRIVLDASTVKENQIVSQ